jgi:hypothetical protein
MVVCVCVIRVRDIMWFRPSCCASLADFSQALPVVALPLMMLGAAPAAADSAAKQELEQRVMDITHMFQNDPRYNRGKTPQQIKDSVEFVTGNVLFVLVHETAHAMIGEMGIPVLGREEDAADALATIVSVKMSSAFADRVVVNAARGWFLGDQRDRKEGIPSTFYDEHGMDLQRAYGIVCLMVGGQPDKAEFESLANEVKLPERRQASCQDDFSNASWSWDQALKSHKRKPEDPKTTITVQYVPPSAVRKPRRARRQVEDPRDRGGLALGGLRLETADRARNAAVREPGRALGPAEPESHRLLRADP